MHDLSGYNVSPEFIIRQLREMLAATRDALSAGEALLETVERRAANPVRFHAAKQDGADADGLFEPFRQELERKADCQSTAWHSVLCDRIRARFPGMGRVGSSVLLKLLRESGTYVSLDELIEASGSRSTGRRVIHVYICRLRAALDAYDFPEKSIATGRRSYCLSAEAAPHLIQLLTRA